jgi:invasion protein IalB
MKRVLIFMGLAMTWALSSVAPASAEEWKAVCNKEKRCQLFSEVKDDKSKILARVYLQSVVNTDAKSNSDKQNKNSKGPNLVAFANLPLGIFIPAGVTVDVDKKHEFKAQLLECNTGQGCRAVFEVQPKLLDLMKKGKTMSVVILDAQNKRKISFHFSLADFEKSYQKFTAKM